MNTIRFILHNVQHYFAKSCSRHLFCLHLDSTISSGINSLAAITLEDFIIPHRKTPLSHERQALITQVLAVAFGMSRALSVIFDVLGDYV